MRTLVIDCATQALSLALFDDENCIANRHEQLGRGHAEALVPMIQALPDAGRADAIAVDVGPGSFTGIRVGIAAARALGFAWNAPVHGYSSLALCAAVAAQSHNDLDDPIAIVLTGGHGETFWQRFESRSRAPMGMVQSTPTATLAGQLQDHRLYGSGAATLIAARGWGDAIDCWPDARAYPALSPAERSLPPAALYGRGADAKPMAGAGVAQ